MSNVISANRVREVCSANGVQNLTLLGAVSGFSTFAARIQTGSKVPYVLLDGNGVGWEAGVGTLSSAGELQRTTVRDSSATGDRVNSIEPGTPVKLSLSTNQHTVFIGLSVNDYLYLDDAGGLANKSPFRASVFVADIDAMTAQTGLEDGETFIVMGGADAYDGSGAVFYWDESDAASEVPPESYEHDSIATGLFKRARLDVQGIFSAGLVEVDAAIADTAETGGAQIKLFFRKKATAATAWARVLADYVSSTVGRVRVGIRYAQASTEKFFADFYSTGDNGDRIELLEPVVQPSRTNSNGLKARSLSWLSGVSRLAIAQADAANSASAADYWELALTKGGYLLGQFNTATGLRAIDAVKFAYDGQKALMHGLSAAGDVAMFAVEWSAASTATDDGVLVFRPSVGAASSGAGRWLTVRLGGGVRAIEEFGSSADWTAAYNAGIAALGAAGGGILTFLGRREYVFATEPNDVTADNIMLVCQPNYTRIKMPVGAATLFDFVGSLGATLTLQANATSGAESITLTGTGLSIDLGDVIRIQRTPGGSITLGKQTQLTRIEDKYETGGNTVVVLSDLLKFAVATSDTYTIREVNTVKGGGAYGFTFDGSVNTSARCIGISAAYTEGQFFDHLGGEYMCGAVPMDNATSASVLTQYCCFDTRGLSDLWAYRSGSGAGCALQFREMGPAAYGRIHVENCYGFGAGWYDSVDQFVDSIQENGSWGRAGKMQSVLDFHVDKLRCGKSRFTGFAVTEGARGHINHASYQPTDLEYFDVVSITRASNVATIVFGERPTIYNSGHTVVIAGATGTDAAAFNGAKTLTWVSGNTYTYASVGVNETAGGTITANLNRSPSLWVNDTGCILTVDYLEFRGVTNPSGDVHTGTTDAVRIGVMRTEGAFTPTWGGTAGSAAQGTGRHVFDMNGTYALNGALRMYSGGIQIDEGLLKVTRTGGVPMQIYMDNSQYFQIHGNAATSATTGFAVYGKDSGGVATAFTVQNAAGVARLVQAANERIEIWLNGGEKARWPAAGGLQIASHGISNPDGSVVLRSFTAAQIADATHAVNTTNKIGRMMIWDSTNLRVMVSNGSSATSAWYVADGSASVTPA